MLFFHCVGVASAALCCAHARVCVYGGGGRGAEGKGGGLGGLCVQAVV